MEESWLLVYLGVALLLAGASTMVAASHGIEVSGFSAIFGIIMASMGTVLSFAALKARNEKQPCDAAQTHPLFYAELELASYHERAKEISGNRAFGFVLISMALFILTISGVFGFFFFTWPLTLLGACCITGGVVIFKRK
jgi:hypothetical protein